jgi:predicted transcriptional regulator
MSGKESLSLDEFATAPRRQRPAAPASSVRGQDEESATMRGMSDAEVDRAKGETSSEASKALRQMKRARMKGASHFVNVNLDRDTKRRLKLASFTMDTSMQALMEKAIRQYLDANGF